jgi:hypothetical protein
MVRVCVLSFTGVCLASTWKGCASDCGHHAAAFFSQLVADDSFLSDVWEQAPKVWPGGLSELTSCMDFTIGNLTRFADLGTIRHTNNNFHVRSSSLAKRSEADANDERFVVKTSKPGQQLRPMTGQYLRTVLGQRTSSTVVINKAGLVFPAVAAVDSALNDAFDTLTNINMYVTKGGHARSVAPHADTQDVFVVQLSGSKTWTLYEPASEDLKLPFTSRGKSGNAVRHIGKEELRTPRVVEMRTGDLLYLPRGWVHTCSTSLPPPTLLGRVSEFVSRALGDGGDGRGYSLHLTMGVETETMKLTRDKVLACAVMVGKGNLQAKALLLSALADHAMKHIELRAAFPVGFMRRRASGATAAEAEAEEPRLVLMRGLFRGAVGEGAGVQPDFLRAFEHADAMASGVTSYRKRELEQTRAMRPHRTDNGSVVLQTARRQMESSIALLSAGAAFMQRCGMAAPAKSQPGELSADEDLDFAAAAAQWDRERAAAGGGGDGAAEL